MAEVYLTDDKSKEASCCLRQAWTHPNWSSFAQLSVNLSCVLIKVCCRCGDLVVEGADCIPG